LLSSVVLEVHTVLGILPKCCTDLAVSK